jgi:hypothetical protein
MNTEESIKESIKEQTKETTKKPIKKSTRKKSIKFTEEELVEYNKEKKKELYKYLKKKYGDKRKAKYIVNEVSEMGDVYLNTELINKYQTYSNADPVPLACYTSKSHNEFRINKIIMFSDTMNEFEQFKKQTLKWKDKFIMALERGCHNASIDF